MGPRRLFGNLPGDRPGAAGYLASMNDLERLAQLGDRDTEIDRLNRQIEQARKQLDAAGEAVRAAKAALAASDAEIAAHKKHVHDLERRFDEYKTRERGALRALEIGAGNPESAEKQLAQCRVILDQTETEQLVAMERDDVLATARRDRLAQITRTEAELGEISAQVPVTIRKAEAALIVANAARDEALAGLPEELRRRYESLRTSKRRNAIVRIADGACSACQMHVQAQQLANLRKGMADPCHGCGRWIVP